MRQRDHTAYGEGGPPQRPARPLVLAADAIRPLGVASILLPSAAEGSCPVELGNPPILALTLMRQKRRHRFANKAPVAPEWCFKESGRKC